QLVNVVRRRAGDELILVDTTERALDAIGSRVPDLMLVPALLSPRDDAALATALRVIAAATHVQMLTIPALAAPRPSIRPGGVLSALRRDLSRLAEPDGCDPTVFAEQIASYLERAARERANAAMETVRDNPPPLAEAPPMDDIATAWLAETPAVDEGGPVPLAEAPAVDIAAAWLVETPTVDDGGLAPLAEAPAV